MRWRRFPLDTIALAALGLLLGLVGVGVGSSLVMAFARAAGAETLAFTGPDELAGVSVAFGLSCTLPAIAAWLLDLLHRGVLRDAPSGMAITVGTASLVLAIPLGLAWQLLWVRGALANDGGITPMFTPSSFDLEASVTSMVLRVSVVIGAAIAIRARRRRS